jgi:hypothetical protein
MRHYKAFYKGKTYDLQAASSYDAQQAAMKYFKAKKSWDVTIVLADVPVNTQFL